MWENIKDNQLKILDRNVPTKQSTSRIHQPWITANTKRLLRRKQKWHKHAKSKYSSNARSTYIDIKKLAQRCCRKAHLDYVRDLVTDDHGGKKLWSYIKGLQIDNTSITDWYSGNTLITNLITK